MGVVDSGENSLPFMSAELVMPNPPIMSLCGSPRPRVTSSASAMVPPAPPRLMTSRLVGTRSASCTARWRKRAVWSQPPPGLAGTTKVMGRRGSQPSSCAVATTAPVRSASTSRTV